MRSPGRHRRPSRVSGATVSRSARIGAVAATSGGLLAAAAAPSLADDVVAADPVSVSAGESALAVDLLSTTLPAVEAAEAPAVAAPASSNAVRVSSYGELGFSAYTPEPEPEPEPVEEPTEATTQAAAPAPEPAQAEPAPEPQQEEPAANEAETAQASTAEVETRESEQASRSQERSEPAPEAAPASNGGGIIGIAAQYTGIPYVWGGTTTSGFDCSGYTGFVYQQAGISLPRSAAQQQAAATPVSNPQPGDLVFWGYPAYHVGIYAGDGMIYDSGTPGTTTSKRAMFSGVSGYGRVG